MREIITPAVCLVVVTTVLCNKLSQIQRLEEQPSFILTLLSAVQMKAGWVSLGLDSSAL